MSWKTEISMKNNTPDDMFFVIHKGQVFENKTIGSGKQNVTAAREYKLIVPGGSKITVEIDVLCINHSFSSPSGLPGRLTMFKINAPFKDQTELWHAMDSIP